ncbi:MAG: hypothetical protein NTY12_01910 [Candidatus Falkowbacteria bacterium]|nr:hypothetical protein [Candidatus Falkowbacteria bacterium]
MKLEDTMVFFIRTIFIASIVVILRIYFTPSILETNKLGTCGVDLGTFMAIFVFFITRITMGLQLETTAIEKAISKKCIYRVLFRKKFREYLAENVKSLEQISGNINLENINTELDIIDSQLNTIDEDNEKALNEELIIPQKQIEEAENQIQEAENQIETIEDKYYKNYNKNTELLQKQRDDLINKKRILKLKENLL